VARTDHSFTDSFLLFLSELARAAADLQHDVNRWIVRLGSVDAFYRRLFSFGDFLFSLPGLDRTTVFPFGISDCNALPEKVLIQEIP